MNQYTILPISGLKYVKPIDTDHVLKLTRKEQHRCINISGKVKI